MGTEVQTQISGKSMANFENARKQLLAVLKAEEDYVKSTINERMIDDFKTNFIELAQNNYLLTNVAPKEILNTALQATILGLNINPIYKEMYILPFNVKGKGMIPSIVPTKQGHVQIAFDAGFFLEIHIVFIIDGKRVSEKELNREQQQQIRTTDPEWVDKHVIGWDISLTDISNEDIKVPFQSKFIEYQYAVTATKGQIEMPQFKLQTYVHKAVRRATDDMFIPRHRRKLVLEKIDKLTYGVEHTAEISNQATIEPIDPLAKNEVVEAEVENNIQEDAIDAITLIKQIKQFYVSCPIETKDKITELMAKHQDWKSYSKDNLISLLAEMQDVAD
ncbi:MAG: recombinase RecT [Sulfurovaceae bacterium]